MPTPAFLLLIATLLPLIGFGVLLFVGKRMGTLAGYVGTAVIGASFVCTLLAMISWYGGGTYAGRDWGFGRGPINLPVRWLPIGTADYPAGIDQDNPGYLDLGLFVDSLTFVVFAMVTLIATLVHIFSLGYMRGDERFPRFFTYLALFCFSMLGLVIGGTLLQLFVFWELIGLCSYLLIGFWYEKRSAANAACKAFVVNRIGDVGFLIGLGILFHRLGNLTLPHLWITLGSAGMGRSVPLPDGSVFSAGLLTITGIALFCGAIGKSAQFPLHVWLPDAMEGPTPVSALIHAATMVAAGVYLVARLFPILTPGAKLFIAIIGVTTLTMAALIAVTQTDIKKLLAFSTVSQLGYMMLGMGVGSWVGGLFHLITHAFFKALLFLAAGSVIHAAGHEQEMSQFGGLVRKIPVTAITFLIGVLAISGVGYGPLGFSGYYSKDMILAHAGAFATLAGEYGRSPTFVLLFALPTIVAFITPFYMARCWMLTFWGRPRNLRLHGRAREAPIMAGPLIVLAILAIIGGRLLNVQEMLEGSIAENNAYCRATRPDFAGFDTAWPATVPEEKGADLRDPAEVTPTTPRAGARNAPDALSLSPAQRAHVHGHDMVKRYLGFWGYGIGLLAGFLLYLRGLHTPNLLMRVKALRWLHRWLHERLFFDELYYSVFVALTLALASVCEWVDRWMIDGAVNGVATASRCAAAVAGWADRHVVDGAVSGVVAVAADLGAAARAAQTGRVRLYVTLLAAAAALGAVVAVVLSLRSHY
jgi:proton-translocating NADH-quinone oxidoreductase chain L